jgi:hypothetical protein
MNQSAMRLFVRSLITEAKEEKAAKLPKSSGKLMDLKKELAALEQMKEEIQAAKFAEKTAETEVEFANLSKFAKELDKIKAGGVALEASIDAKIEELKGKIDTQKNKIKEMIGMTPAPGQEKMVDEKKEKKADLEEGQIIVIKKDFTLDGKDFKKGQRVSTQPDFDKIEAAGKAGKIKQGEDFGMGIGNMEEARFKKGTDIGKPGKGFEKIAKSAAKQYGSKEAGKKVAGAILKKVVKEELDTNTVYSGAGQNTGNSGSSLQFKIIEKDADGVTIRYTITPNSKQKQAGAGDKSSRVTTKGYTTIKKSDVDDNGYIKLGGENFRLDKNFLDQLK